MLEKIIRKAKVLNETDPLKFEAEPKPHQHTSDEVFMGELSPVAMRGMSLTDVFGGIVVDIAGKADKEHFHTSEDVDEISGSMSHDGASLNEVIDAFDNDISALQTTTAGLQTEVAGLQTEVAGLQTEVAGKQDKIDFSGRDAEETTVTKDDPLDIAWAMDNAPFRVFYIKCAEHGYLHELVTNCIFSNDVELSYDNVRALIVFNAGYDQYFGFISPELDL